LRVFGSRILGGTHICYRLPRYTVLDRRRYRGAIDDHFLACHTSKTTSCSMKCAVRFRCVITVGRAILSSTELNLILIRCWSRRRWNAANNFATKFNGRFTEAIIVHEIYSLASAIRSQWINVIWRQDLVNFELRETIAPELRRKQWSFVI